ncbi:ATP-binding protein [Streptomyces sp. NPDC052023]|uniref:ATP-binding protein n=1 Tax=Streptomyces sp. NPDC052023 TaxID=3365681 RepID=UPI0037D0314E
MSPSVVERAEQIVAELAANAALHGRAQGRDVRLALRLDPTAGLPRIAVTDARGDHIPSAVTDFETRPDSETGRGLLLVTALADRWDTEPYPPGGETVWAEIDFSTAQGSGWMDSTDVGAGGTDASRRARSVWTA